MRFLTASALIALTGAFVWCPVFAQETHPFSVEDMLAMDRLSGVAVSPDATHVAFVVRETDLEADRGRTDLWLVGVDGEGLRRLTTHEASDSDPTWSLDGENLYFLSSRSGSSQVWMLPLSGGEARQVTDLPLDVANLIISPQGTHLAFSLDVFVDCGDLECTAQRLSEIEESPESGMAFERLLVRHWDTWKDGRRSHVFVVALEADGRAGAPVDLMKGMDSDSPSKPFGGSEEFTFTPDGRGVVFASRVAGAGEAWSTDHDLYVTPIDGSREPVCLTEENEAWDTAPAFSPDGSVLAYTAMRIPGYEADRLRVVTRTWESAEDGTWRAGPPTWLTEEWDRSASSLSWTPDGRALLAHTPHLGRQALFRVDARTGEPTILVDEGTVAGEVAAGGRIFLLRNSLTSPNEIWSVRPNGKDLVQVTRINAEKLARARMGRPEQFTFIGANDDMVYGWVVEPVDFDPQRKYPVAFLVHGGPQGSFGDDFHYRWNPQAYAGAGYAVVMVDFHGSVGYGQEFTDSIQNNWGGWPLEDLQKGLAYALDRYPWMDGERVAALGASYGGYMINWIAGNWPDRFTCLVNHDGLFDLMSMYYSTEELWFPEREFSGTPWSSDEYARWNPSAHVEKWQAPMLVVHGVLDYRVPYAEGLATFTALQRRGIPSRLLVFPDENHFVLRPSNSVQWHREVLGWLDRWTR